MRSFGVPSNCVVSAEWIDIEVAYALPECQFVAVARIPARTSAKDAVCLSGIRITCPEIDIAHMRFAVYGRRVQPGYVLRDGDRLELLRPLIADPKAVRRARARTR